MTICILGSEARPPLSNLYMKVTWCDMQERQFQTPNQVFQTCPNKYLNAPSQEWQVNRFGSKVLWIIVSKPQLWAMPKICLPVVLLCWHAETQFRHLFRRTHCHLAHVFQTKNKAHPSSCWHHHTSCHPHHSHDQTWSSVYHSSSFPLPPNMYTGPLWKLPATPPSYLDQMHSLHPPAGSTTISVHHGR